MKDASGEGRKAVKRKFVEETGEVATYKRRKTRFMLTNAKNAKKEAESLQSTMLRDTNSRALALLRMQYSVFNSPAPAALYRIGSAIEPGRLLPDVDMGRKRRYHGTQYFCITVVSDIAQGATGKVHDAKIEVQTSDGHIHSIGAIVKIALDLKQREKLRHEYAVYRYMALKGVNHVVAIYGLFEDAANEAMILVMSHVGESLVKQPHYREHRQVKLTEEEQNAFKAVMTEIHEAGIRHYDIRPENLMMDVDGNAAIIDFDMAKVRAGKHSRQREFEHLFLQRL